ncbi:hypothetical protein D046_8253B, partial [Vibrio parahaemolyticus V-223/04]
GWFVNKG